MIVTRNAPDEVRVVRNPVQAGRAALGVRFGSSWYFSFHGLSSNRNGGEGGGDSAAMIEAIDNAVDRWGTQSGRIYEWTVGGDFNVSPTTLRARLDRRDNADADDDLTYPAYIYNTAGPTQVSGGNLDYFVSSERIVGHDTYLYPRIQSDHNPIQIGNDQLPPPPPAIFPSRVSTAGDSIPTGQNSSNGAGYRSWVYDGTSTLSGIYRRDVDMVGTERSGDMPDPDHDGHPGWRIDEVAKILDCSIPAHRPNLTLLMAGTNDLNQNWAIEAAPERLGSLVDQILADAPETTVLVSELVPSTKEGMQEKIDRFNAELPQVIEQRRAAGKHVMLVSMGELTVNDVDGSHPNDAGYKKMGEEFLTAIYYVEDQGWLKEPVQGTGQKCDPDTAAGPGWNPLGVLTTGMPTPEGDTDLVELNGDDRADYVKVGLNGTVRYALNMPGEPGRPNWVELNPHYDPLGTGTMKWADMNGDGRDDRLIIDHSKYRIEYRINTGVIDGEVKWSTLAYVPMGPWLADTSIKTASMRFADIDGDGRDDFLRVGEDGSIHAYENRASSAGLNYAEFKVEHLNWAPGVWYGSRDKLRLADVNGDRKVDYMMVGSTGAVHAYFNNGGNGGGGFNEHLYFVNETGYPGDKVAFRDISGDGKADYVVVYDGGSVRAWLNRGGNI